MTYIQITTRCNMTCDHCCFACGKKGDDMTRETWQKALEFTKDRGDYITIGGGEPTLHKHFREFLLDAIAESEDEMVPFMVTNGSTKHADLLYKLTKAEVIRCELSQDEWHDPIEWETIEKFRSIDAIRDVSNNGTQLPKPKGRAVTRELAELLDGEEDHGQHCTCPGWMIDPKGGVHACGCLDSPELFNIHDDDWQAVYDDLMDRTDYEIGQDCWFSTIHDHAEEMEGIEIPLTV